MFEYKILSNSEIIENEKILMDFFQPAYNEPYWEALKNSDFVWICLDWEKIVWWWRIITDKNRFALFCDFFVLNGYRKKGIWTEIMKIITENDKFKVQKILLVSDSKSPWLVDFYYKFWFKIWWWTYMELKRITDK